MLALVYIKYDKRKGMCAQLFQFIFPRVLKSVKENVAIYEAYMPFLSKRLTKRCEKKLIAEMKRDKISRFLCGGACRKLLEDNGFIYAYSENYLKKNLFRAVSALSYEAGNNAKELKICICQKDKSITAQDLFKNCAQEFRNVALITHNIDEYALTQDEISQQYGAATIVTESYSPAENADIIICLSLTDELFKNAKINDSAVIISVERDFLPKAYMQERVITAFSKSLSSSQAELCRDNIKPWELCAALDEDNKINKTVFSDFYCFGRVVTPKSLMSKCCEKLKINSENAANESEFVI